ncbi:MAG: alanine--tRNA ligase, partial [Candidatus Omnitrophica bacterium]|nr:alanine--tRNA ligase [Candidatus Omnitrophota bacterium]
ERKTEWYEDSSGRFAEIWNLVFTQFNRQSDGSLIPLAAKNIDTGAGLERIACVLQKKRGNFEIDIFQPMIDAVSAALGIRLSQHTQQIYAMVDHGRAATVAITDGAFPSNEGRGYVIRKLIRRSVWRASSIGVHKPFLYQIVPAVIQTMGAAYPELKQSEKSVSQTIQQEEEKFLETLDRGLIVLSKLTDEAGRKGQRELSGEDVFLLYDTYGFPDELTKLIAKEKGLGVDEQGFTALMTEQKKRAKEKSKISSSIFSVDEAKKEISHLPPTKFLGYQTLNAEGNVLWLSTNGPDTVLILDQTPFYPEGGGQVGDQGVISGNAFEFLVRDTQKREKTIVHIGTLAKGSVREGMQVMAKVDRERRESTKRNHTATHLMQSALRNVLGNHVRQVGSLVSSEKLRFDFSHQKALTREEIQKVEQLVNSVVMQNHDVNTRIEPYHKATKEGAIAFFGDKYEESVRVIDVLGFSKELCGGTHCSKTGDIGMFVIVSESAIASGTRRIEALTGLGALHYIQALKQQLKEASDLLKTAPDQLTERIEKLQIAVKNSGKQQEKKSDLDINQLIKNGKLIGKILIVSETMQNTTSEELRKVCDDIKQKISRTAVIILFGVQDDKVALVVALTKDLEKSSLDATQIAKELALICEGSAGGRKDLAQGGGKNPKVVSKALARVAAIIQGS